MEKLRKKIRMTRLEAGLTQTQLADMAGISQSNLNRIEHGKIERVGYETIKRIKEVLNIVDDQDENEMGINLYERLLKDYRRELSEAHKRVGQLEQQLANCKCKK